ncbi:MAG: DJ-1/PfpI family protein [Patescibacteria group bacterium]|nr:DJ-1/PfpI family protein [Patescibacteria group bacterium]
MKTNKILMVIAPSNYRDEELEIPKEIFEKAGFDVRIASKGVVKADGILGGTTDVDLDIEDVIAYNYDAVVFIGGSGASEYFNNNDALRIAEDASNSGIVLGAICIAPSILANAGLLNGKKATAFPSEKDNLAKKGAHYTGDLVTVDGKIVTAKGPEAAEEFGEKIIRLLR